MNSSRSIICSEHRLARFVAWARLALAWIAMMLLSDETPRASRRIVRRRYCLLDLGVMTRLVRNLVIIRAGQLSQRRRRRRPILLDSAPAGFTRRTRANAAALRRTAGSWLRRRLAGEGGAALRVSRLLAALADLDTLAGRLVRRLRRGLTRLRPIVMTRAPQHARTSLAEPAPCAADSS
jgi:hypothetical protein